MDIDENRVMSLEDAGLKYYETVSAISHLMEVVRGIDPSNWYDWRPKVRNVYEYDRICMVYEDLATDYDFNEETGVRFTLLKSHKGYALKLTETFHLEFGDENFERISQTLQSIRADKIVNRMNFESFVAKGRKIP